MTTPLTPLCACGCGAPRRPRSKYATDRCGQRIARIKARDYDAAYHAAHSRPARASYPASRKVTVIDPLVATPYEIPHSEFLMFRAQYLPGTRIIMDGQEMTL